jgi:formylglycine-generating enzyme required for sulfatase activity
MKSRRLWARWGFWRGVSVCLTLPLQAQTEPKLSITMQSGCAGITVIGTTNTEYAVQATTNLPETNDWATLTNLVLAASPWVYIDYTSPGMALRFYRAVKTNTPDTHAPAGMVLVPAGSFTMVNTLNDSDSSPGELPTHTVYASAFYMDQYEVTKALWDETMNLSPYLIATTLNLSLYCHLTLYQPCGGADQFTGQGLLVDCVMAIKPIWAKHLQFHDGLSARGKVKTGSLFF